MNLKDLKQELLKNSDFKTSYYRHDLAYETSRMLIEARIKKGMTQKQLADLIGSTQSSIARAENGKHLTSLDFLEKVAKAYRTHLTPPQFDFMNKIITTETHNTTVVMESANAMTTMASVSSPAGPKILYVLDLTNNSGHEVKQSNEPTKL